MRGENAASHTRTGTVARPPTSAAALQFRVMRSAALAAEAVAQAQTEGPRTIHRICMGSWKVLDARHVARNHFGWLYDGGMLSGFFNETETDELSRDGNSYSGTNELKMYDLSGNKTADLTGTDSATRLAP